MKHRSNSILAHIPQSSAGEQFLKQALFITNAIGMRIFLLDVIKPSSFFFHNPKSKKNKIRHKEELNGFTEFVKKCLDSNIPDNIILRIAWGKIMSTLITETECGGYEFVMIDKSESQNNENMSRANVDIYVSKSYCPVLSINKDYPLKQITNIVVPVDISQRTKKHLYWATLFAIKFNAQIHIVSALNIDIEEHKSLAFKNADKIRKMLNERGVKCDIKILKIHNLEKQQAILEYIEEVNPGMVIIRTHQESRFTGKKIGPFVSEIIHGCKMPVFTVGGVSQNYDLNAI
ncbi:MAG TPA: universal stress protein [Draconibacterium sp.]|nr:universal stress protein [Draconibacterium sp.]